MYVIVVYDTERDNCVKLHKYLKRYLFWNQRSVFEGELRPSQYNEVKKTLKKLRAPAGHITIYRMENAKLLNREEIGEGSGAVDNVL